MSGWKRYSNNTWILWQAGRCIGWMRPIGCLEAYKWMARDRTEIYNGTSASAAVAMCRVEELAEVVA
jgi:hypothetical protein